MPRMRPDGDPPTPRGARVPPPVVAAPVTRPWPILTVRVPPDWKRWLDEAAAVRGLSVASLVRQCIRQLMITRHDA